MVNIKETKDAKTEEKTQEQTVEKHDEKGHKPKHDELADLTDTLKRLQAEFENYKKRTEKENIACIRNANANLIKDLLPVLDSFELAIKNNGPSTNPEIEKFKKGMEMIYAQLFSILEDEGLRPIVTKDLSFDPYKHEVLLVQDSDKPDDLILQELQKGYMLSDVVLRHSKVMIAKHKSEQNQDK